MNETCPPVPAGETDALLERVARAIAERVGPELGPDGDGIELVGMDDDRIVQVRLTGACGGGCSSSVARLMMIDAILRAEVPGVRFVETVP